MATTRPSACPKSLHLWKRNTPGSGPRKANHKPVYVPLSNQHKVKNKAYKGLTPRPTPPACSMLWLLTSQTRVELALFLCYSLYKPTSLGSHLFPGSFSVMLGHCSIVALWCLLALACWRSPSCLLVQYLQQSAVLCSWLVTVSIQKCLASKSRRIYKPSIPLFM